MCGSNYLSYSERYFQSISISRVGETDRSLPARMSPPPFRRVTWDLATETFTSCRGGSFRRGEPRNRIPRSEELARQIKSQQEPIRYRLLQALRFATLSEAGPVLGPRAIHSESNHPHPSIVSHSGLARIAGENWSDLRKTHFVNTGINASDWCIARCHIRTRDQQFTFNISSPLKIKHAADV